MKIYLRNLRPSADYISIDDSEDCSAGKRVKKIGGTIIASMQADDRPSTTGSDHPVPAFPHFGHSALPRYFTVTGTG